MKWFTIIVSLWALPAWAVVGHNSIFDGDEAVNIEASSGIEWLNDEKSYIARGDAVATRGKFTIKADTLAARYRDGKRGEPEIYELRATGDVRIQAGQDAATAQEAVYNMDKQYFKLSGDVVTLTTAEQKVTANRTIEYWAEKRLAIATGRASVYRDAYRLTADTLNVTLAENSDTKALEVRYVEANNNVVIKSEREEIRGNKATYDMAKQLAMVTGDVALIRDANKLVGTKAEINIATGVSRLVNTASSDGRVKGVFRINSLKGEGD